jgi:hypothetical protein
LSNFGNGGVFAERGNVIKRVIDRPGQNEYARYPLSGRRRRH